MNQESASGSQPRPPSRLLGLRSRMLTAFCVPMAATLVLVGMVNTFGIPFTGYRGTYDLERDQVLRSLSLVADLKKERFELWLTERKDDIRTLCRDHSFVATIGRLSQLTSPEGQTEKGSNEPSGGLRKQTTYQNAVHELRLVLHSYPVFAKIGVTDAKSGLVLVSTEEADRSKNVSDSRFFVTALNGGYEESVQVEKDPVNDKPYLVISRVLSTIPTGSSGETVPTAVVSMYVDTEEFLRPMLYTGGGLGETGDIVLVNQDGIILMSLKFPLKDGSRANILQYRVKAKPAVLASQGNEGIVAAEDYRGVPVLAAYRHLRVAPDRGWGMVVKRDQTEVFGPLWHQIARSSTVGFLGLAVAVLLGIWASSKISSPIRRLCSTVQEVEAGNLAARSPTNGPTEVCILANAFNSMIDRVQNWHQHLEEQVKARTAQANLSNKELAAEVLQRKQAEQSLLRANRALRTLSDFNQTVIRAESESTLMTDICRIVVEVGGYAMAWVGFAQQDTDQTVRPVARYGLEEGYLDKVSFTWSDDETGRGPTGTCIRTKVASVGRQTAADESYPRWRHEAIERGYLSSIALPLIEDGACFGALSIYASHPDAFDEAEISLLSELAADLSFGLRALKTKSKHQESEERYRLLVDLSPDGIIAQSRGKIILANRAAATLLGATRPEELVDRAMRDFVHPDYWQKVKDRVNEMFKSGIPQPLIEEKFLRLDRAEIDVEVAAAPVIQKGKKLVQVIFRDISARKRARRRSTATGHSSRTGGRGHRHNRPPGADPIRLPRF